MQSQTSFNDHEIGLFNPENARGISSSVFRSGNYHPTTRKPIYMGKWVTESDIRGHRKTLGDHELRTMLMVCFANLIKTKFPQVNLIAGVATAGIPHGMLVAQDFKLPFVYVRSSPKAHGLTNLIEGVYKKGQRAVVIEDLIPTGGSSLKVVEALRSEGVEVLGLAALFSYGFPKAHEVFKTAACLYYMLNDYKTLLPVAVIEGYITERQLPLLEDWYKDPQAWSDARKQQHA